MSIKNLTRAVSVLFLVVSISSCSIFKGKKCDCPKFSEVPTQENVLPNSALPTHDVDILVIEQDLAIVGEQ